MRPHGEPPGKVSASLVSVQLQSRIPSVDPGVEISDPPRGTNTVARCRPRRRQ